MPCRIGYNLPVLNRPAITRLLAVVALASTGGARRASAQHEEAIWYLRGEESIKDFLAHAGRISVVAPQVYEIDSTGAITGSVDPRVVTAAREHHVRLMPLVMNPGFDQPSVHRILTNPGARNSALRALAALCRDNRFYGIQFDLENIHVSD